MLATDLKSVHLYGANTALTSPGVGVQGTDTVRQLVRESLERLPAAFGDVELIELPDIAWFQTVPVADFLESMADCFETGEGPQGAGV